MDLAEVKGRRRTGNKKDGFIIKASDLDWLIAAVEQLTAERDRLKSALTRLRHSWPTEEQTVWAYAGEVSDIAEEALSLPPNAVNEASGLKGLDALYTKEG